MQQLMYAFGLYILRISQQFIIDNKKEKIKSFYGGDLKFNEDTKKLVLNKDTTLYYKHYNNFKSELVKEVEEPDNKVFIRLDIQNYFDNVRVNKLLSLLKANLKPSEQKIYNFDSSTIEQISFFYRFLGDGVDNLPQSDNNIISNFISHLYLIFGDLIIEDALNEINNNYDIVTDFKIIRYVDDIYIAIDFKEMTIFDLDYNADTRNGFIYQLLNKISDEFYKVLNLRFNGKAELFRINNEDERKDLLDLIKKVSEDYPDAESDSSLSVPDKVNRLLGLIDQIKARDVSQVYRDLTKQESETLKDVYDKAVLGLMSTADNIERLENKFRDFNYDLLRVYPQPLIILITLCPNAKNRLDNYLLNKDNLTTFDRGLLVILLCQSDFTNTSLFEKLKANEQLKPIFDFIKEKKVTSTDTTGSYKVNIKSMNNVTKQVSYIEQVRQRVFTERRKQYSIALNHLLNEIQLLCCTLESKDIKTYKEPDVDAFLTNKGVDNSTKTKISNLFNRRNNNPVSHPGSDSRVAWSVEEDEYTEYKKYVAKAIEKLFE
jgi:AbiA family abortive infection protein